MQILNQQVITELNFQQSEDDKHQSQSWNSSGGAWQESQAEETPHELIFLKSRITIIVINFPG